MDKKKQKKSVIKRKSGDENSTMEADVKKAKPGTVVRGKVIEETKVVQQKPVEVMAPQTVEFTVAPNQQIIHANQIEGSFDQPVFLHMKGDPVHLGTNTVIVYEQGVNSGNFTFGGSLMMDASGRIMVTDNTIYDVKDEGQEEQYVTAAGEGGSVMTEKEDGDIEGELLQYAIKVEDSEGDCYDTNRRAQQQQQQHHQQEQQQQQQQQQQQHVQHHQQQQQHQEQEYEIVQIVESDQQEHAPPESPQETLSDNCARWLNAKYDYIVRKLQLDYDAGVKLLHSPSGVLRCVYLTTPSMQLAFNSVPQFLCIETCIEFCSPVSGSNESVRQSLTLLLAEDGNGRSVIVSAGISTLGNNVKWLLETFKSCNPAWRQVRCILADPGHNTEAIKWCFPGSHVCCNVFQAVRWAARHSTTVPAPTALLKSYVEALLKGQKPDPSRLRRCIGVAINRLPRLLEGDNYTNVLHKGLEKLVERFNPLMGPSGLQPEEFVTFFFEVVRSVEDGRQAYALSRLQDTVNSKQSPTDTITQYAYFLIHQQTTLAQRAINQQDENSTKEPNDAINKYGTSTQECSCIFSKVFRLPCRHILMLTTELKVKTHIPFEPRWTVHHCLFGCELETRSITPTTGGTAVVNQNDQQIKQQYILPSNEGQQVIFCSSSGSNTNSETIQYAPVEAPGQPA